MKRDSLRTLKGIGEKTEALFSKLGVRDTGDLLKYYPRSYDAFEAPVMIEDVRADRVQAVCASILRTPSVRSYGRNQITMAIGSDGSGEIQLNWFHMPYLRTLLKPGTKKVFRGRVTRKGRRLIMEHPRVFDPEEYERISGGLAPVYALTSGLSNQTVSKAVRQLLEESVLQEFLPDEIRERYQLPEINYALSGIHFPKDLEMLTKARRRIVFDEFLLFLLGVARMREAREAKEEAYHIQKGWLAEEVQDTLPYRLTEGQRSVLSELERDLSSGRVMNRMIQGDVGSGKTILAFLAMIQTGENGYQSALMAPTEVLAKQHARALRELFEANDLPTDEIALLVGSLGAKEKREAYARIASGKARYVIGTHALIQDPLDFSDLALVITDEQHRFGVRQRVHLQKKGREPHVLVMSATPIPRTLAMILYGDLDISLLKELPKRRLRVKNALVDRSYREKAYRFMRKELTEGHQIYVICPAVEPSEELPMENVQDCTMRLKKEFADEAVVGSLHGRMRPAEKDKVMERFLAGEIDILVSTTVVEVGVDVPNATVMMIEDAERFGLAQLHQLRGRVGRGEAQSYCIFVQGNDGGDTSERLTILRDSNDGFEIAEKDLALRGPGDLFGVRQSGIALFDLADIYQDREVLLLAYEAVQSIMQLDAGLALPQNQALKERLLAYLMRQNDEETAE